MRGNVTAADVASTAALLALTLITLALITLALRMHAAD